MSDLSYPIYSLNYKNFNPLGFWLLSLLGDASIRFIVLPGGSSSGKSYSIAQAILLWTVKDGENTLVYRKVGATIKDTIYEDFKVACRQLGLSSLFDFKDRKIICTYNNARIDFKGLDDSEKIKGISNYKRVCMDELSEFELSDFKQIRKRLRGKHGQQIIVAFNPIKETHWIKKDVLDLETLRDIPMEIWIDGIKVPDELSQVKTVRINSAKSILNPRTKQIEEHAPNMVVIQTTYLHNFWVVGSPDGTYGYYDDQCIADFEHDREHDPDYYNVYALGEWGVIHSGSEFFGSFNRGRHVVDVGYDGRYPVHLSVDNNVLPYISVTFWQVLTEGGAHIRQIAEICAESPDNTVRKASALVVKKLKELGVDKVFLHGDASTRAANTIDEQKRSWLDLFIDGLEKGGIEVVDCVGNKNPNVSLTGEFINAILENRFEGIDILVDESCKTSVEDYMSVQKDMNGAILKTKVKNKTTGQTYEEHGHLSDTFRYLVADVLKSEFIRFASLRKRNLHAGEGILQFYNPDTESVYSAELTYCMPNINGRFVMIHGRRCGDKWHLTDIRFKATTSTDEMKGAFLACKDSLTILECPKSYYIMARELRESIEGDVRVIHESGDMQRRIAATSDFVRQNILFNKGKLDDDEYNDFLTNLLDYNTDDNIEGSAALSGFIQTAIKLSL